MASNATMRTRRGWRSRTEPRLRLFPGADPRPVSLLTLEPTVLVWR
jgi:hypothetical protein